MKHFIIAIILFFGISSMHIYSAETATVEIPDMEKIENAVRDSRSPYYYPDLMKKYLGNDTTMTLQDSDIYTWDMPAKKIIILIAQSRFPKG